MGLIPPRTHTHVWRQYLGLVVLEAVSLVHHQTGPVDGLERRLVDGHQLVGGQQHVEFDQSLSLREGGAGRDVQLHVMIISFFVLCNTQNNMNCYS